MADTSYMPAVYRKQGGNEMVVASGGDITVESGGDIEVESGATIDIQSGATLELDAGSAFSIGGTSILTSDVFNMLYSLHRHVTIKPSTAELSVSVLTYPYGVIAIGQAATGFSKLSIKLPAPSLGHQLWIDGMLLDGDANLSIYAQSAGGSATLFAPSGSELSGVTISAIGFLKLICYTAGVWTIVEETSSVTNLPIS